MAAALRPSILRLDQAWSTRQQHLALLSEMIPCCPVSVVPQQVTLVRQLPPLPAVEKPPDRPLALGQRALPAVDSQRQMVARLFLSALTVDLPQRHSPIELAPGQTSEPLPAELLALVQPDRAESGRYQLSQLLGYRRLQSSQAASETISLEPCS